MLLYRAPQFEPPFPQKHAIKEVSSWQLYSIKESTIFIPAGCLIDSELTFNIMRLASVYNLIYRDPVHLVKYKRGIIFYLFF